MQKSSKPIKTLIKALKLVGDINARERLLFLGQIDTWLSEKPAPVTPTRTSEWRAWYKRRAKQLKRWL